MFAKHYWRRLTFIALAVLPGSLVRIYAQAPSKFAFQGVARGADGKVISNKQIGYSFQIHKGSANGPVVYQHEGTTETNSGGIFNLTVGNSTNLLPDSIKWGADTYFLQTGIDPDGAEGGGFFFTDMGTTQLLSVPYAIYSNESGKWKDGDPIVQKGVVNQGQTLPPIGEGAALVWYPRKAAFRAGRFFGDSWEDSQTGFSSIALGSNNIASHSFSAAIGSEIECTAGGAIGIGHLSKVSGGNAISIGGNNLVQSNYSLAIGFENKTEEVLAFAFGQYLTSKSYGGIAMGRANDDSDSPSGSPTPTDRIFQIGNGSSPFYRSNALTILRNGNVGIGNESLNPQFLLDIGGRPRIRHTNGNTAGMFFSDSQNNADAFVGMKTDNQVGFYIGNAWRFWVDNTNAFVNGFIVQTSDARLKNNVTSLRNSLSSLSNLRGYHYTWKDKKQGADLQTGLLAQEVEKQFPELVVTDKDGFKAVNYIGLIPHLIEALKELDERTSRLATMPDRLTAPMDGKSSTPK